MTTKEKAILEAYGEFYDKYQPDENGWSSIILYFDQKTEFESDKKLVGHGSYKIRPKSLQGIETNNGWLPYVGKSIGYYDLVYTDKGNIYPYPVFVSFDSIKEVQTITHYQSIQKPKTPIY